MLPNLPFVFWSLLVLGISTGLYLLFRGTVTDTGGKLLTKKLNPGLLRLSNKLFYLSVLLAIGNGIYIYFRYIYEPSTADLIGFLW